MTHPFCPGYAHEPFATLCQDYPGPEVYPWADFRVEWGPVFHRGRLDGSARVLVLGQDPAAHEAIARRILVGEAGQRTQGILAKLGIDHSYVMINTFLYSAYGQGGGDRHKNDPAIAGYRNRWLDALLVGTQIEAVITLGGLAATAMAMWQATPAAAGARFTTAALIHPTYPESSSASGTKTLAAATAEMLANWNTHLPALHAAITHPDTSRSLVLYGTTLAPGDLAVIPEADAPPGLPDWMRSLAAWASRQGATPDAKRASIAVTIPKADWAWTTHP
jgi:uracil-DNA glycosylase